MIIEAVSNEADFGKNEDIYGEKLLSEESACFWVIDGASCISDKPYVISAMQRNDVQWFVATLSRHIFEQSSMDGDPRDLFEIALIKCKEDYNNAVAGHSVVVPEYAKPLATGHWIRVKQNQEQINVSFLGFGDCVTLIQTGQDVQCIPNYQPKDQEEKIRQKIQSIRVGRTIKADDLIGEMLPELRSRRAEQQSSKTSWLLGLRPEAARHALVKEFSLRSPATILICSDGLFRLVDLYKSHTPESLIKSASENGLNKLIDELRAIENKDSECEVYPRLKCSDDASAICLKL